MSCEPIVHASTEHLSPYTNPPSDDRFTCMHYHVGRHVISTKTTPVIRTDSNLNCTGIYPSAYVPLPAMTKVRYCVRRIIEITSSAWPYNVNRDILRSWLTNRYSPQYQQMEAMSPWSSIRLIECCFIVQMQWTAFAFSSKSFAFASTTGSWKSDLVPARLLMTHLLGQLNCTATYDAVSCIPMLAQVFPTFPD